MHFELVNEFEDVVSRERFGYARRFFDLLLCPFA
jgi:hypothetical protein